jgi:hypothetical protein
MEHYGTGKVAINYMEPMSYAGEAEQIKVNARAGGGKATCWRATLRLLETGAIRGTL